MEDPETSLYPQLIVVAAVSASHMSMPNHWLPYSLVARAHGWSLRFALFLTFLGALGHVSVTLLLTLVISEISGSLISDSLYRILSSTVLLLGGIYYLYTYLISHRRDSCCEPASTPSKQRATLPPLPGSSQHVGDAVARRAAALSLVMLTTLSPCVGSMPVLLAVLAPPIRFPTVLAAGTVLLTSAAVVMMTLVAVSYVGAASMDFGRVRRHERLILGTGLVALSLLTFFVFSNHSHHHHYHTESGPAVHEAGAHRMHGRRGMHHHHHSQNGHEYRHHVRGSFEHERRGHEHGNHPGPGHLQGHHQRTDGDDTFEKTSLRASRDMPKTGQQFGKKGNDGL